VRGDRAVERIRRVAPESGDPRSDAARRRWPAHLQARASADYAGPILMLTARGEATDEVTGLELEPMTTGQAGDAAGPAGAGARAVAAESPRKRHRAVTVRG